MYDYDFPVRLRLELGELFKFDGYAQSSTNSNTVAVRHVRTPVFSV